MTQHQTLRDRLIARNLREEPLGILDVPATGRIDKAIVTAIHGLALAAKAGDVRARDELFFSLRPRLNRISWVLKPWPNGPEITGVWDRDDVHQETWVVFAELLEAWDATAGFVPYLFARFAWRLRDRILRGIGKSQHQYGSIRVSENMLDSLLTVDEEEQPESVAIARRLLEELIKRKMMGAGSPGELEAWHELINSSSKKALLSPTHEAASTASSREKRTA